MRRILTFFVSAIVFAGFAAPIAADSPITITSNKLTNNFRENLLFQVGAESSAAQIARVELLVQIEGVPSLGRFTAEFTPGTTIQATYEWNLARNYLPPGVTGQYWWEIQDSADNQVQSPRQPFRVEDQAHAWRQVSNEKLAVYWYAGSDNVVASPASDDVNLLGLIFAATGAFAALVSIVLAIIFHKRRVLLAVFVLVSLCSCATPLLVFRSVGDAGPRGDTRPISFGQALFDHGVNSVAFLERDTGVTVERQIQIYVYGNRDDFFNAMQPGTKEWTGGRAYPDYGIVMINISPSELDWGKRAVAHEITHQVIHQAVRSPLGDLSLPPLIDEGLAVYYESPGSPDPQFVNPLKRAIQNDTLISLRSLTSGFPTDSNAATLSYAESYSVVDFIFRHYGRDKMAQLLQAFKQGGLSDDILVHVFGVNLDSLEIVWRQDIGAKPRAIPTRSLTTATPFPTFSLSTEATPTPSR
jgi:hypothetical protein